MTRPLLSSGGVLIYETLTGTSKSVSGHLNQSHSFELRRKFSRPLSNPLREVLGSLSCRSRSERSPGSLFRRVELLASGEFKAERSLCFEQTTRWEKNEQNRLEGQTTQEANLIPKRFPGFPSILISCVQVLSPRASINVLLSCETVFTWSTLNSSNT